MDRILKSVKKKFGRPVKKAATLSSDIIRKFVENLLGSGEFKDERTAVFILTQFVLFGRYEEVSKLKKKNITLLPSGDYQVLVEEAKNFNCWDARKSYIAKGSEDDGFDPAAILSSYIDKIGGSGSEWLFPNFRKGKGGSVVFLDKPVSYDNMLKLLREGLDRIGVDGKSFTLHSVRTGALSEAANSGRCDREGLRRQVRWSTLGMVDHYHKYSLENKLKPCRALGLYSV